MSELDISSSVADSTQSAELAGMTAGSILRSAREAAGLHVAALAVAIKIPVKKLEALESDRLDLLHDAVFVRALAATVCRTLKIDSAPVLAKLPATTLPKLSADERGINAPFHPAGDKNGFSVPTFLTKPQAWLVFLLLTGVGAVFLFPEKEVQEPAFAQSSPLPKTADPSESTSTDMPVAVLKNSATSAEVVATTHATESGNNTKTNAAPGPQIAVSDPGPMERSSALAQPGLASSGTIVFKARSASWVKVVDSAGVVRLSKTLADGEIASASGLEPLSIVVGRADVVDVEVRGLPFNLSVVAKENVARFEVK